MLENIDSVTNFERLHSNSIIIKNSKTSLVLRETVKRAPNSLVVKSTGCSSREPRFNSHGAAHTCL